MDNQKMKLNPQLSAAQTTTLRHRPYTKSVQMEYVFRFQRTQVLFRCRQWLNQPREAEDACQEVFFRVVRAWESFRADCKVETWLYLITRNVCRNFNRKARRRRHGQGLEYNDHIASTSSVEHPQELMNQEELCMQRELIQNIQDGLSQLTESSQEIMRLKIEQGLTYDEVAAKLGLPSGTIKSRVFRARTQLKAVLAAG